MVRSQLSLLLSFEDYEVLMYYKGHLCSFELLNKLNKAKLDMNGQRWIDD